MVKGYNNIFAAAVAIVAVLAGACWRNNQNSNRAFEKCADTYAGTNYRQTPPLYDSYVRTSSYFTMKDGTLLAHDVYLPSENFKADRLFLHFTRYNRRSVIRWPFQHILGETVNGRTKDYLPDLLNRGIPIVTVDVRGTGASFGSRPIDLHPDEIQDLVQVLRQAKTKYCQNEQCNISTGGISYDGIIGLWLAAEAAKEDPVSALGVDSVAVLFSPLDIYDDIAFVGGVRNIFFLDDYNLFVSALERAQIPRGLESIPRLTQFFLDYVIGGPAPVDTDMDMKLLNQAVEGHHTNWDFKEETAHQLFKDDVNKVDDSGRKLMVKGIQGEQIDAMLNAAVRVFFYAGTHDAASIAAAERFAARSTNHGVVVPTIFGSWTHGLRKSNSPFDPHAKARGYLACYNMYAAVADFFSNKTIDSKSYAFVTGAEEFWDFATWPPPQSVVHEMNIQLLEWSSPGDAVRHYATSNTSSPQSHHPTRWNLVHAALKVNVDPQALNMKPVVEFSSNTLKEKLAVVGTVVLHLSASPINGEDLVVFAALDEITANGDTVMITEAVVDARHQCVDHVPKESLPTPAETVHCVRSYFRKDYTASLNGDNPIPIFFQPVAHQFSNGSRIRLRLHAYNEGFRLTTPPADHWKIDLVKSMITLPTVEKS